jgi:hypothetical protein
MTTPEHSCFASHRAKPRLGGWFFSRRPEINYGFLDYPVEKLPGRRFYLESRMDSDDKYDLKLLPPKFLGEVPHY